MGHKTHPIGFRLGFIKKWDSRWFAKKNYAGLLNEDFKIRGYARERLKKAAISKIEIERTARRVTVTIHTARPGIVIGRKGVEVDRLRDELKHLTGKEIYLNIEEIRIPELDPHLVAENIARQIEQRIAFRRAMKRAVVSSMRMGAKGIKVACSGRLAGAEIARKVWFKDGRIPLQTIRADINYASRAANTAYGTIGVKVWIFMGEVLGKSKEGETFTAEPGH